MWIGAASACGHQFNVSTFEQRMFGGVGSQHSLAEAKVSLPGLPLPVRSPSQAERAVVRFLGPWVARRDVAADRAAVGPGEPRRRPHQITQVARLLEFDPLNAAKRLPVVFAFENHFEHWSHA